MIGLLGGTFNPVHLGHTSIAQDVLNYLALNRVEFLPCHTPVHRDKPNISTQQRVKMLQLATQSNPKFQLNTTEIKRGGASYMIDTLKSLTMNSTETWVLILGTDAFNGLHRWKQAKNVLNYCHIVVCQRPDEKNEQTMFKEAIENNAKALALKPAGCIHFLNVKQIPFSATMIREKVAKQQSVAQYLSKPVLEFIQTNHLYTSR